MTVLVKLAIVLFVAGEIVIFVVIGSESWPLLVGWAVAAVVVAGVALLVRRPLVRLILAAILPLTFAVAACVGGLFFVPAAAALLFAAYLDYRRESSPAEKSA